MTSSNVQQIAWSNPDPTIKVKIPMNGPSNRYTGYGNHFVELVLAMQRCGADVSVMPYFTEPPLPPEFLATMIDPWDFNAPVVIRMANPTRMERKASHTIGITTWETSRIPAEEVGDSGLTAVDELIVPCRDNIATMQEHWPNAKIHYVPEGVDAEFFSFVGRDWQAKPLRIGAIGALTYRKGIDLLLEAFIDVAGNNPDVELHIMTTVASLSGALPIYEQAYSNIKVRHIGWSTREEVRDWYQSMHALIYPFRGEGWGMCGPEMMATGGIVIAPDKMGAAAWMTPEAGYVIPSEWTDVLHWGPHWHGKDATDRYGQWLGYENGSVHAALERFLNAAPSELRTKSYCAAGQVGHLCNWDYAGQRTVDVFIDAFRSQS
jgi:glycosyltransferase involved in cell wall biosynthesis